MLKKRGIKQLLYMLDMYKKLKRGILVLTLGLLILTWLILSGADDTLDSCVVTMDICLDKCRLILPMDDMMGSDGDDMMDLTNNTMSSSMMDDMSSSMTNSTGHEIMEHMTCMDLCSSNDQLCKKTAQGEYSLMATILSSVSILLLIIVTFEWLLVVYYGKWSKRCRGVNKTRSNNSFLKSGTFRSNSPRRSPMTRNNTGSLRQKSVHSDSRTASVIISSTRTSISENLSERTSNRDRLTAAFNKDDRLTAASHRDDRLSVATTNGSTERNLRSALGRDPQGPSHRDGDVINVKPIKSNKVQCETTNEESS